MRLNPTVARKIRALGVSTHGCLVLLMLLAIGCPSAPPEPEFEWTYFEAVDDATGFIAYAEHANGDGLGIFIDEDTGHHAGAVYFLNDEGGSVTAYRSNNGLPVALTTSDGWVYSFANYTANAVDVSITTPAGESEVFASMPLPDDVRDALDQLQLLRKQSGAKASAPVRESVLLVQTAGCIASGAASVFGGLAAPLAVSLCGSALTGGVGMLADDPLVDAALGAIDIAQCAAGNLFGCAGAWATTVGHIVDGLENARQALDYNLINPTSGARMFVSLTPEQPQANEPVEVLVEIFPAWANEQVFYEVQGNDSALGCPPDYHQSEVLLTRPGGWVSFTVPGARCSGVTDSIEIVWLHEDIEAVLIGYVFQ